MYRDTATVVENIQRFLDRVAMNKKVYYLQIESDPVVCESGEGDGIPVMLFFSDAAYARRLKEQSLPETEVAELDLFDFMYKWLPGMLDDGVLAGPNWTGDMVGAEVEPTDKNSLGLICCENTTKDAKL